MTGWPTRGGRDRVRGFTLMEILVALTLFGILMAAMLGGLRLGTRVWEASADRLDDGGRVLAVQGFLRERLEEALPIVDIDQASSQPAFAGEAGRLRLASSMPVSLGEGIFLMELDLRRQAGDGPGDLILRWRPWPLDPAIDAGERVILDDVAGIAFGYFGARDRETTPAWHERWQNQSALPDLIRVDLAFSADDRRQWRPLIVSPMVDEWYDTNY